MSYNTLEAYYKNIFALVYHHKWNMNIEDMIPFERDLYISMIKLHMDKLHEEEIQRKNKINKGIGI